MGVYGPMQDKIDWSNVLPWAIIGGAGMLGRLTFHARQVQLGRRKPFSWALLWDIPVALMMGWTAYGVGIVAKMPWEAQVSAAMVASYLGPYALDLVFLKWADWKFGKPEKTNDAA